MLVCDPRTQEGHWLLQVIGCYRSLVATLCQQM